MDRSGKPYRSRTRRPSGAWVEPGLHCSVILNRLVGALKSAEQRIARVHPRRHVRRLLCEPGDADGSAARLWVLVVVAVVATSCARSVSVGLEAQPSQTVTPVAFAYENELVSPGGVARSTSVLHYRDEQAWALVVRQDDEDTCILRFQDIVWSTVGSDCGGDQVAFVSRLRSADLAYALFPLFDPAIGTQRWDDPPASAREVAPAAMQRPVGDPLEAAGSRRAFSLGQVRWVIDDGIRFPSYYERDDGDGLVVSHLVEVRPATLVPVRVPDLVARTLVEQENRQPVEGVTEPAS